MAKIKRDVFLPCTELGAENWYTASLYHLESSLKGALRRYIIFLNPFSKQDIECLGSDRKGKIFVAPPQTLQPGIRNLKSPPPYCKLKKGKTTFRQEHFHL